MKKILFGLIATVMFANVCKAQENAKNQYDYIGKIHNEVILEYLKQNTQPNLSIEEILNKVKPVILNNQSYKSKFGLAYSGLTETQIKQYMPDVANNFKNLIDNQNLSSDCKLLLNELMDNISSSQNYNAIYNYVIVFENTVINSNLSNSEKQIILCSSSVARYSSFLWFVIDPKTNNSHSAARFHWWSVLADVAGGVLGSGGGPAGTAAGATGASLVSEAISNKP